MFNRAKIKLTLWYVLIIGLVSLSFSGVIYQINYREYQRILNNQRFRLERQLNRFGQVIIMPPVIDPEVIEEARMRLLMNLAVINLSVLALAAGMGYLLAGKTLDPIKQMMDDQNRFIADASHELRTPLTSLKSAFEVYLRDKKPSLTDAKLLAEESIEEVDKLHQLTNRLLTLSTVKKLDKRRVEIIKTIGDAIDRVAGAAKNKEIQIIKKIEKHLAVEGDPNRITDLWAILLDNAIKYSNTGGKVWITTSRNNKEIKVTVKDEGEGIKTQDLEKIFDRFYRTDTSRSKNGREGYGLGLSIAQQIVRAHGAEIKVKSKWRKGSEFSVIFQI